MLILKKARNIVALTFVILAVVLLLPVGISWADTVQARRAACMTDCEAKYDACKAQSSKSKRTGDCGAWNYACVKKCSKIK